MPRTNKIIEQLKKCPCTYEELPYRMHLSEMSEESRNNVRSIRMSGNRAHRAKCGHFQTIYYLKGDDDRAVNLFAEVNAAAIQSLDLRRNTILDSGLTRELAQKLRAIL